MSYLISVIVALAMPQPEPAQADVAWVASSAFCEPETVLPLPDDTLLISNVCDFRKAGTLQITPVAGPLVRYCNSYRFEILGGDGISSANHGYAASHHLALIPTGFDNKVVAININESEPIQATDAKSTRTCVLSTAELSD